MTFRELKDIHTHQAGRPDALLSLPPEQALAGYDMPYSLELHPWKLGSLQASPEGKTNSSIEVFLEAAEALKDDPNLMAIGECGLDNKCDTPLSLQIEAFKVALQTAKELQLPVIIHCVGYWAEMMQCVKDIYPFPSEKSPLPMGKGLGERLLHGFRKGPQLAQQLLNAGFSISLGKYFNPATKAIIPPDRLYWESDTEPINNEDN